MQQIDQTVAIATHQGGIRAVLICGLRRERANNTMQNYISFSFFISVS